MLSAEITVIVLASAVIAQVFIEIFYTSPRLVVSELVSATGKPTGVHLKDAAY